MKCVLFARVSSREQEFEGYSLPSQEKLLKEYAQKKSFVVVKRFSISESANGRCQRETFKEMMRYTKEKNIKAIICEKVDRLTRNFRDAVLIDDWLEEDEKREVHLVKDSLILHKNSHSQEKLNWGVRVLFAKNTIDNLSEEVRKGQQEKLEQGWLPRKSPLGYKTIGEQGHKTHVIDEQTAPFIKKSFEYYATGCYSLNTLVKKMYEEGFRTRENNKVIRSRMHAILSDCFYMGKIKWKGKIYDGKHTPLISNELFDSVQIKLKRKLTNPQYKKHLPIFKAMIKCGECGGTITWEIQKGWWYGHCNHYRACNQKKYLRQEKVEEQLFPYFDKVAPKNERVLKWLQKALKQSHTEEIKYNFSTIKNLQSNLDRIQKRLETIYEDKIDGEIDADFYEKKFKEYTTQKEEILKSLNKHNQANTKYYEVGYAIHELAYKAKEIYLNEKTTTEAKRLLLSYIFSNLSLNTDKMKVNYTLAFEFLAEWIPRLNKIFEPTRNRSNKRENEVFTPSHPVVLPG